METFEKEFKLSTLAELEDLFSNFLDLLRVNSSSEISEQDIDAIFRIVHSIKGNSKASGFNDLARISHEFEDLILKVKEKKVSFCQNVFDICFSYYDSLITIVERKQKDFSETSDFLELSEKLKNFVPYNESTHLKVISKEKEEKNILLVDDNIELIELLSSYMNYYFSANITISRNGNEASSESLEKSFDVIVCDYKMPVMDGQTFIKNLRENYSENKNTPVIFLSALEPKLINQANVWENVFFVKKPISKKELVYYLRCSFQTKNQQRKSA